MQWKKENEMAESLSLKLKENAVFSYWEMWEKEAGQ
jgi:hypothetical protein